MHWPVCHFGLIFKLWFWRCQVNLIKSLLNYVGINLRFTLPEHVFLYRTRRDDIEDEDDQESFFRVMKEDPLEYYPDDDEELDYDSDGNPIAPPRSKVKHEPGRSLDTKISFNDSSLLITIHVTYIGDCIIFVCTCFKYWQLCNVCGFCMCCTSCGYCIHIVTIIWI